MRSSVLWSRKAYVSAFKNDPRLLTLGSKHHSQHFGIVMTSTCSITFKKKKNTVRIWFHLKNKRLVKWVSLSAYWHSKGITVDRPYNDLLRLSINVLMRATMAPLSPKITVHMWSGTHKVRDSNDRFCFLSILHKSKCDCRGYYSERRWLRCVHVCLGLFFYFYFLKVKHGASIPLTSVTSSAHICSFAI